MNNLDQNIAYIQAQAGEDLPDMECNITSNNLWHLVMYSRGKFSHSFRIEADSIYEKLGSNTHPEALRIFKYLNIIRERTKNPFFGAFEEDLDIKSAWDSLVRQAIYVVFFPNCEIEFSEEYWAQVAEAFSSLEN